MRPRPPPPLAERREPIRRSPTEGRRRVDGAAGEALRVEVAAPTQGALPLPERLPLEGGSHLELHGSHLELHPVDGDVEGALDHGGERVGGGVGPGPWGVGGGGEEARAVAGEYRSVLHRPLRHLVVLVLPRPGRLPRVSRPGHLEPLLLRDHVVRPMHALPLDPLVWQVVRPRRGHRLLGQQPRLGLRGVRARAPPKAVRARGKVRRLLAMLCGRARHALLRRVLVGARPRPLLPVEEVGHGGLGRGEALRSGPENAVTGHHLLGQLAHKVELVAFVVAPGARQVKQRFIHFEP
mmetsp:Transcript_29772/g.65039  ORF Transcript_29772/g.65039 Transcript_29772/m.65039 type:complete len:295 (+) Transcript_29772:638-1522(+)